MNNENKLNKFSKPQYKINNMKETKKEKKDKHKHGKNDLIHEIEELTHTLEKQNSYTRDFWSGVVKGIGYAVGATILFGILITLLSYIVRTSDAQWVKQLAEWAQLSEYTN